jgi:hypothetical protein
LDADREATARNAPPSLFLACRGDSALKLAADANFFGHP